jgi:hypothetical protein
MGAATLRPGPAPAAEVHLDAEQAALSIIVGLGSIIGLVLLAISLAAWCFQQSRARN